jgi:aspartyl-tRNA(Asn)/glutamyl-tRNA(Gln) amidotransferase subunit A
LTTIAAAARALRSGKLRAVDLVESSLHAIDASNATTNAFIRVDESGARASAELADGERARGLDRGPLHGVPVSVKDIIDVAGLPTTAASKLLDDRPASADATVVARMREAGAVILGKTNLHEFALGTTSEESAFGAVRNPNDRTRSAGGSSGGSAAAVAAGMGLASIGTDTGGSIRIPAAACGIVGLKPSLGEVPTSGVVPLSFSLDHVGPLTRTVSDAASLWAVLSGRPIPSLTAMQPSGLRLGLLEGYFLSLSSDVRTAFESALDDLRRAGMSIAGANIPEAESIAQTYVNVALPEAAACHAHYLETRAADYMPNVKARLEVGRSISAVDYLKAREAQRALRLAVDTALAGCDALVLPTLPIVAPPLGAAEVVLDGDPSSPLPIRSAMLRQTQLFNLTGHPAISLPIRTPSLPVGLQLVGRLDNTAGLLDVAAAVEKTIS